MTHSRHVARWRSAVACALLLVTLALTATPVRAQITTPIPPRTLFLPSLIQANGPAESVCPTTSDVTYTSVPVEGSPRSAPYPPVNDPDLNLVMRSYQATDAYLGLVDIGGHTDTNAPRLHTLFAPPRVPTFTAAYRVYDWDWACPLSVTGWGCRGELLTTWDTTLITMQTARDETIYLPERAPDIYAGVYKALVLYAEAERITLKYARNDTPADGYVVHVEGFCVDPNLLALYQTLDAAGRTSLPALRSGDRLGQARLETFLVAVRDTGSFLDPRSAKDWWQGR